MKKRPYAFIGEDEIDHDGEIFDYIKELHAYLWRVIRAVTPGASGTIDDHIDRAIDTLEARAPEVEALADALSELADLMDDIVAGEYTPDTFTTQPAHAALVAFTPALACGASEVPE